MLASGNTWQCERILRKDEEADSVSVEKTASRIQLLPQEGPAVAGAKMHIWVMLFETTIRQRATQRSPTHFDRFQHISIPRTSSTPAHSMVRFLKLITTPLPWCGDP